VASEQALSSGLPVDIDWWHRFERLLSLRLPDLVGKAVLEVGPFDGYFSFAAERFGAARVVAVDARGRGQLSGTDAFQRTRDALASKVERLEVDPLDICPRTVGEFDVVLLPGVLGHVRRPLQVLEGVASVTKELLVAETPPGIVAMLGAVGFDDVVSYPVSRTSAVRLAGLATLAKVTIDALSFSPTACRRRLIGDAARRALCERRVVAHGRRRAGLDVSRRHSGWQDRDTPEDAPVELVAH
jgi:SAM-dependent methyltransferase